MIQQNFERLQRFYGICFLRFSENCTGKFSLICCCSKKRKEGVKSSKKYCWVNVSEDFKILVKVSVDGMSYITLVRTLRLGR